MRRPAALACLLLGACGSDARVRVEPVRADPSSTCGFPAEGETSFLVVTALGDGPEDSRTFDPGAAIEIGDFPIGTRQLEVAVQGGAPTRVRSLGRTAPLDLGALPDGTVVPILMAPPEDGCPVGGLSTPRDRPLVVATADGALVVGGRNAGGELGTAEWYDPATGHFEPVATPSAMQGPQGAFGMSATVMPDGRVVLTGGVRNVYVVFDPETRTFDEVASALNESRGRHASIALDDERVLLAGGCQLDEDGTCQPTMTRFDSKILRVADGNLDPGPDLVQARFDGTALLEPAIADADAVRVLLVGGVDDTGDPAPAERIDPEDPDSTSVPVGGTGSLAAPLASGSVLTAFAPGGTPPVGVRAVAVPGVDVGRALGFGTPRAGATLTALEDGDVLIVGGDGGVQPIARYDAATGAIVALTLAPAPDGLADAVTGLSGQGAARLPDGTVLLVGGRDGTGTALDAALVFRPDGDGPFSGAVAITPEAGATGGLIALDPDDVTIGADYVIHGRGSEVDRWVVIAGMRPRELELGATLIVETDGGVGILLGMTDPAHHDTIELVADAPARLVRRDDGAEEALCVGADDLAAADLGPDPTHVTVRLRAGTLQVFLGTELPGRLVLDCAFADARAGMVGLTSLGLDADLALSTISVTR